MPVMRCGPSLSHSGPLDLMQGIACIVDRYLCKLATYQYHYHFVCCTCIKASPANVLAPTLKILTSRKAQVPRLTRTSCRRTLQPNGIHDIQLRTEPGSKMPSCTM